MEGQRKSFDEIYAETRAKVEAEVMVRGEEAKAYREKRRAIRKELFGTDDPVATCAPQAVEDFDALLGEHAAQLRSAIRHAMEDALSDSILLGERLPVLAALGRLVRVNVAIARTIKASKTRQNSTL